MTSRIQLVVWVASLMVGGMVAVAQSIAPPIAEYRGTKVEGMFELQNTNDYPMAVVLETKSFSVDEHGQVVYRSLDPGITITMGTTSFVIHPHDRRMVFYKAAVSATPASFSIIPAMTKAGAIVGVRVNYILPHMIYVYQKDRMQKSDVRVDMAGGILHIRNLSNKLGRIQSVEAARQDVAAGFPLFPGQTREFPVTGDKVNVTFEDGFKIGVN
jgi:hypothetical protein